MVRHTFTQTEAYDSKGDRWRTLTAIVGRHGFGAGTIRGTAYFVGGNKGCGGADTTDELLASGCRKRRTRVQALARLSVRSRSSSRARS